MMTSSKPPVTPLRPDQREPATAPAGPVLILGGAGAGATHTIAARIAVWLKNGAGLMQIACLTHSARGGDDIRQRVLRFLPDEGPRDPGNLCRYPPTAGFEAAQAQGDGVVGAVCRLHALAA